MYSFWAVYSLRMSFWIVPVMRLSATPCSFATTSYMPISTKADALIVYDVDTSSSGMSFISKRTSSIVSTATPIFPISGTATGWSES